MEDWKREDLKKLNKQLAFSIVIMWVIFGIIYFVTIFLDNTIGSV